MSEWKKVNIGDICKIVKGTTGIASAEPGEYPLVVTAEERKTCSTYQFDQEAVCIPLVSSSGHGKKSLKNVHYQSGKFALGTILCAVIPNNPQELDARYLHQYLQFYKDIILVPLMKGAANVSLSMKDIATVEFPLPPIERQRELSNLFVSLQEKQKELSAEYEKQTEYAKLLRQSILQQAIEGKLTTEWRKSHPIIKGNPDYDAEALFEQIQKGEVSPSLPSQVAPRIAPTSSVDSLRFVGLSATPSAGSNAARNTRSKTLAPITNEEKPFEIPEGWKWVRLESLSSDILYGVSESAKENGKYKLLRITDIQNNFVDWDTVPYTDFNDEKVNQYLLHKGDILFARTGGTVGKSYLVEQCPLNTIYASYLIRVRLTECINSHFIKSFFESLFYWRQITDSLVGTGQPNCNGQKLANIVLTLPPLKEQEEIVNKIESLLAKVTELENQIQERETYTKQLMQSILKNAFEEE